MISDTTIAALATPYIISAIAIIRISGEESISIVNNFFVSKNGNKDLYKTKKNNFRYGFFKNNNGTIIDECLFLVSYAPHSYTGENTIEIHCHGSLYIIDEILKTLYSSGIITAKPGEFTKRAFLNNKMNLLQSEAVADLINATNLESAQNAISQLSTQDATKIFSIRESLLKIVANFYAMIDFPDEEINDLDLKTILIKIENVKSYFKSVVNNYEKYKIINNGIICSIIGSPNVGKSSLLNLLLNKERAIVTNIPGTTRDIIEDYLKVGNVKLKLNDTAGIRETTDIIEKIGIKKTIEYLEKSDLIFYIIDNNKEISENEKKIINQLNFNKTIMLINKCDLERKIDIEYLKKTKFNNYIEISINTKQNISLFKKEIIKKINAPNFTYDGTLITNRRHISIIIQAIKYCEYIIKSINKKHTLDVIINDIENMIFKLGEMTGDTVTNDIVNNIFKHFCVGK